MEIGPLLPGRIPMSLVTDRLQTQLQDGHRVQAMLQDQVTTGHKFMLLGDSPSAAITTVTLQSLIERKTQMASNTQTASSLLGASETAIASVADAVNKAKALAAAGIGDSSTPQEKASLALEAQALIRQVVNAANTTFRGRYLFGGSQAAAAPFTMLNENTVRYEGDTMSLNTFVDLTLQEATNVDGNAAFGALTEPVGADINPALTLQTSLGDLFGGKGVTAGTIDVTLSSPASTQTIDLSKAKTVSDLKAIVENAFPPGAVTVSINAAKNGIQIAPAAGTIAITDPVGSSSAARLHIASAATASIDTGDLDPRLTATTRLADLNGGTGIGPITGNGIRITNGITTRVVDLAGAVTVEDLFNRLRDPDLGLSVGINAAGNGLAISSRLSGVSFSIGENNGLNATNLGIRTMTGGTPLSSLNFGGGVPVNNGQPLKITRRDGTTANVDLTGAITVQDVMTKINAVDPGNLVASLNTVGNGISLLDNSGTGPLTVDGGELGTALGMAGTEPGTDPTVALTGQDTNQREVSGALNVLIRLMNALNANDSRELARINGLADKELARLTTIRGDVGGRLKTLEDVDSRLKDESLQNQQALSDNYDSDLAEVLTQLLAQQTSYQATLKIAAQTLQMSLAQYL